MTHAIVCELISLILHSNYYHHHHHHNLQLCLAAGETAGTVDKVLRPARVRISERRGLVQNAGCQAPCLVAQTEYGWDGARGRAFCRTSPVVLMQW